MAPSATMTWALQALPRASGPKACVIVASLPSKMEAALHMRTRGRRPPGPPPPPILISVLAMLSLVDLVLRTEAFLVVGVPRLEVGRPLDVDELADDYLVVEADVGFFGPGVVADLAVFAVPAQPVEAVPHFLLALKNRRAGGHDLDERKAGFLHGLDHGVRLVVDVEGRPAGDVDRADGFGQEGQVEGRFKVAEGGSRKGGPFGGWRGHLPAGHGVVEVIDADDRDVDVPPGGVDEVVAADGDDVAVAAEDDDFELGVGQLH